MLLVILPKEVLVMHNKVKEKKAELYSALKIIFLHFKKTNHNIQNQRRIYPTSLLSSDF